MNARPGIQGPIYFPPLPQDEESRKHNYLTIQFLSGEVRLKVMKAVGKLISSVRDLLRTYSEAYRTTRQREDAVWRTLVIDQDINDSSIFIRPSRDTSLFRLGSKFLGELLDLRDAASKDELIIDRSFSILNEKKLLRNLTFEKVRQMWYGNGPKSLEIRDLSGGDCCCVVQSWRTGGLEIRI